MHRDRRRRAAVVMAAIVIVAVACGCSSDGESSSDDEAAVAIGPGSRGTPPAAALVDAGAQEPPAWVAEIPEPVVASAPPERRAVALDLAASTGLRAPRFPAGSSGSSAENDTEFANGTYRGTMTIDVAYFNYCVTRDGNLAYAGSREYTSDVEVIINDPAEDDGVVERSPFNLIISSETGVEGAIVVVSATVAADNRTGTTVLFDYWSLDADGDELTGTLTDRWPGFAMNTITTEQPLVPCQDGITLAMPDQLMEGAELRAAVDGDDVELELLAQSLDRETRFRATIEAERVGR
jgi:hypothetical protein